MQFIFILTFMTSSIFAGAPTCLKEGVTGVVKGTPARSNDSCCEGLKERETIKGCETSCKVACGGRLENEVSTFVCIACGDKKCNPKLESKCNCPEDCK